MALLLCFGRTIPGVGDAEPVLGSVWHGYPTAGRSEHAQDVVGVQGNTQERARCRYSRRSPRPGRGDQPRNRWSRWPRPPRQVIIFYATIERVGGTWEKDRDTMRVYLDTCRLQRPLDDKTHARIALEAEAVLAILALCEHGSLTLVSSDIISFEISQNPHPQRRTFVLEILEQAYEVVILTDDISQRAKVFEHQGIKAIDALHLASAEATKADFFCTCDDRLYRRTKSMPSIGVKVVTPLELAQEVIQ